MDKVDAFLSQPSVAVAVLGIMALPFVGFLALAQLGFFIRGGFSERVDLEALSPDGRHLVRVVHREPFPSVDLINPPAKVACVLTDSASGEEIDRQTMTVYEESCLGPDLAADWTDAAVTIRGFNACKTNSIQLSRLGNPQ